MPVAVKVAVPEDGPFNVQLVVVPAVMAAEVIVYPVGRPPCNDVATSVQFATALPLAEFVDRAA